MMPYLKPGQDFADHPDAFRQDFGFSKSVEPQRHFAIGGPVQAGPAMGNGMPPGGAPPSPMQPPMPQNPQAARAPQGAPNPLSRATVTMPAGDMAAAAHHLVNMGRRQGAQAVVGLARQRSAARNSGQGVPAPAAAPVATPAAPAALTAPDSDDGSDGVPGMAKGGNFIAGAVKHPGRMTELAKRHGVSTHQEMERDKSSPNPSLRAAANLGLRLTGGDLKPHRK